MLTPDDELLCPAPVVAAAERAAFGTYIRVPIGAHGGMAHVAPDIDPATFAALGQMCDALYEQVLDEGSLDAR